LASSYVIRLFNTVQYQYSF